MRLRSLALLGVAAVIVLSGCSPEPVVPPSPSASSQAPTPTPTPTQEPIVAPEAAFDVTCDDVSGVVTSLLGASVEGEKDALLQVNAPNWYPGPPQFMMQRAGGIGCSAGDPVSSGAEGSMDLVWEIVIVPNAQVIVDGVVTRGGRFPEREDVWCGDGHCQVSLRDGDVLMTGMLRASGLVESDADRVRTAMAGLLASASGTLRDVEYGASEVAGLACESLLTAEELTEQLGTPVEIVDHTRLGGWGVPAEVYYVNNGGRYCMYAEGQDVYHDATLLSFTTLPSGAWAFETLDGETPVTVAGADAALSGVDFYGRPVLDVRVGLDWLRFVTPDSSDASAMTPIAEMAIQHLTRGRPAPQ
ncbi:MAG: hypothetical protein U1E32_03860 [Rhodoglobus sp.]|nr:hypothetical protein [Rhodoglobus sp.]